MDIGNLVELSSITPDAGSDMGGMELLMNNNTGSSKRDGGSTPSRIDAGEIDQLEHDLNNLSMSSGAGAGAAHDFSGGGGGGRSEPFMSVPLNDLGAEPALGKHTTSMGGGGGGSGGGGGGSTWDGFSRATADAVGNTLNPDAQPLAEKLSHDEELKEKFKYLRKLESMEKNGFMPTKHYTMDSDLTEMRMEYETAIDERHRTNSVKFQANLMMTMVNGIEFLNSQFDPFDVKLDGWGEQVHENVREYDDVFGELYDKYKSRGSIAPELKLLFQLGGSAVMVHMTNSMFRSAPPDVGDIFRSNPELMRQFQSAAVNSMAPTNPGMAGFMNSVGGMGGGAANHPTSRSPPTILSTSPPLPAALPRPHAQQTTHNAPMGAGGLAMDHQTRGGNNPPPLPLRSARPEMAPPQRPDLAAARPEMRGPSDIDGILSGLKPRAPPPTPEAPSNISADDIGSIGGGTAKPRRRRPRGSTADKNIVSLDI